MLDKAERGSGRIGVPVFLASQAEGRGFESPFPLQIFHGSPTLSLMPTTREHIADARSYSFVRQGDLDAATALLEESLEVSRALENK